MDNTEVTEVVVEVVALEENLGDEASVTESIVEVISITEDNNDTTEITEIVTEIISIEEVVGSESVEIIEQVVESVEIIEQGPAGPPGPNTDELEQDLQFTQLTRFTKFTYVSGNLTRKQVFVDDTEAVQLFDVVYTYNVSGDLTQIDVERTSDNASYTKIFTYLNGDLVEILVS